MELLKIKVADFEGPFDLLLHLIRKNKMDINNIKLYTVTNQYLEYLDTMKEMDLDITSEFIVVAATLIEIKSKSLLPKIKIENEEDIEDVEKKLLEKLLLYKTIKASTDYFRGKANDIGCTYSKKPEIIEETCSKKESSNIFKDVTLINLYNVYNQLIENYLSKQNKSNVIQKNIRVDQYKIEDKYDYLLKLLEEVQVSDFNQIMDKCSCKLECVVTFLALLELMKQKRVRVFQKSSFGEIIIEGCAEENEQN